MRSASRDPLSGASTGRRLATLLVVLALVGAPALMLRAFCLGRSCDETAAAAASVPFCPLPASLRDAIEAGFRQGRSPDVMATAGSVPVVARVPGQLVGWPWAGASSSGVVPLAFLGPGVAPGPLPAGVGLDDVAPTLAALLGYAPPHPDVRAGRAIDGVVGPSGDPGAAARSPLAVEIVWKGVASGSGSGSSGHGGPGWLEGRWPARTGALVRAGASTLDARVGSLPLDPAAVLTTIGTGGLPSQHGITGTRLRTERGGVARAWGPGAPEAVITSLPDDLDRSFGERAQVGLVATDGTDRGLVGDGWYLGADRDRVVVDPDTPVRATTHMLEGGFGTDGVPDVLGVVLRGPVGRLDRETAAIVHATRARVPAATFVITAAGAAAPAEGATPSADVVGGVETEIGAPVVRSAVAGGVFLDADALAAAGLSADAVVQAMRAQTDGGGDARFAQVYPAFSVAFARYC